MSAVKTFSRVILTVLATFPSTAISTVRSGVSSLETFRYSQSARTAWAVSFVDFQWAPRRLPASHFTIMGISSLLGSTRR